MSNPRNWNEVKKADVNRQLAIFPTNDIARLYTVLPSHPKCNATRSYLNIFLLTRVNIGNSALRRPALPQKKSANHPLLNIIFLAIMFAITNLSIAEKIARTPDLLRRFPVFISSVS